MNKKALENQRDKYKNMRMDELIELRRCNNSVRVNKLREKYLPEKFNPNLECKANEKDEK